MSNTRGIVTVADIKFVALSEHDFQSCIDVAQKLCKTMIDRQNLHSRDVMEKFNNILMGEGEFPKLCVTAYNPLTGE